MKRLSVFFVSLLLIPVILSAQTVQNVSELFELMRKRPDVQADNIIYERAGINEQLVKSKLKPKIDLFGTYDYATSPVGMVPIPPNDLLGLVQHHDVGQPFSHHIARVGASISMPIFVKSIRTLAEKAKSMQLSAQAKKRLNILQHEATIVSLNANLKYMNEMLKGLAKKRTSILKTKEIIQIKVDNQRVPKSALIKISDALNQIDLTISNIQLNKSQAASMIQQLTGIYLETDVPMEQIGTFNENGFAALEPLQHKLKAQQLGVTAEKQKSKPAVFAKANYNHSLGIAYNNNNLVNKDFATIGLAVKMPIFDKVQSAKVLQAQLDVRETENLISQKEIELATLAKQLQVNLQIIDQTLSLYQQSINAKKELLKIAKVAYNNNRMTIEDYLKYEDDLVLEESKYYKSVAEKWQSLMKLAVIYGNDVETIVK